jgi:hypothetical protein
MRISRESIVLIGICVADLASTVLLLRYRAAIEGNPVMSYYLDMGIPVFVVAKASLVLLPIFVAEWARRFHPQFVTQSLRVAIAAYLGVYLALFARIDMANVISSHFASAPPPQTARAVLSEMTP